MSKAIAMLPSPTAAATRFTGANRTSPHAKMPGTLVSRKIRVAVELQRPAGFHIGACEHRGRGVERDLGRQPRRLGIRSDEDALPARSSRAVSPVVESRIVDRLEEVSP